MDFLGLGFGRGGNASVGGFVAGRDGCGRAEVDAMMWQVPGQFREQEQRPYERRGD